MSTTAYPLAWPPGRPRTPAHRRTRPKFGDRSFAALRDDLLRELKRLGARYVVLSTNIELRQDGLPYSGRRQPEDPGVAVYFTDRKDRQLCFTCDRWSKIEDNIRAIEKTIDAIRGIERWGTGDAVDAAFSGFQQLPPPASSAFPGAWEAAVWLCGQPGHLFSVREIFDHKDRYDGAYRGAAKRLHPDAGGNHSEFVKLQEAAKLLDKHHGGGG